MRSRLAAVAAEDSATRRAILTYLALALFFGISAAIQLRRYPVGTAAAVSI